MPRVHFGSWRGNSVGNTLDVQAWGLEFDHKNTYKKAGSVSMHFWFWYYAEKAGREMGSWLATLTRVSERQKARQIVPEE